ncbi:MAG: methionine--tRNA ligase [Candidatus Zixiibacteriota bacterium]|nr:MAG: methionine--tRNA ligase [candidate division Zixibacteria bacterium]
MRKPFYVTTPIYYVNDRPHIGHSYTTIAADLLARFHRISGREAFFLTGTDEHGSKVAEAAEAAGLEPRQFCDRVVKHFKDAWEKLSIDNSDFIRTTQDRHVRAVRNLLNVLRMAKTDAGEEVIYSGLYEGLYCTACEKFLTEKDLVGGVCPDHNTPPALLKEKNYFFRLTAFTDKLRKLIEKEELIILPEERRHEVLGLFKQGLTDFSISREHVTWGIPLPFDESQVCYVWVEALCNYITAIGYSADEELFKKWWHEADAVHLMAKDILKFHCIYWPAILMAAGLPLPNKIFLHGFFTVDGAKMSKTLGNQIDPNELVEEFGPDAARYLLLTQYPFGVDGDIQRSNFVRKYNSDLANDLGNLVSRVAKMIIANYDGKLPPPTAKLEGSRELIGKAEELSESVIDHLYNFRIGAAIDDTIGLVRLTNRFFDGNAPWKLVKEGDTKRAGGVLYACSEVLRIVSILLYPTMPNKAKEILSIYGLGEDELDIGLARTFFQLKPGTEINFKDAVFPRLKEQKKSEVAEMEKEEKSSEMIDIDEFARAKMVVAEILEAEKVSGADKLLKIQIDIGDEKRQIIAGIAEYYAPDELKGKKIVVVRNLKPATIRGIDSNGMLLAAHKGKKLYLVTPEGDLPPGTLLS